MVFKFKKNRWYGEITSSKTSEPIPIYLGSGSAVTVLSLKTASQLLGWDMASLSLHLSNKENTEINRIKMVPCVLYDVVLCNKIIYSFYCMIDDTRKRLEDVIGADFISSCELYCDRNKDIELRDFSNHTFRHRFVSQCGDASLVKLIG